MILRPYIDSDLPALREAMADPDLLRLTGSVHDEAQALAPVSGNFRIQIGPAGQNRGLGTEATRLIVGYGFEKLGLHRISLEVYAFNPRALHPRPRMAPGRRNPGIVDRCLHPGVHNGPPSRPPAG